jgi:hypothetical protein
MIIKVRKAWRRVNEKRRTPRVNYEALNVREMEAEYKRKVEESMEVAYQEGVIKEDGNN